jgi:hypothetical protein
MILLCSALRFHVHHAGTVTDTEMKTEGRQATNDMAFLPSFMSSSQFARKLKVEGEKKWWRKLQYPSGNRTSATNTILFIDF